MTPITKLALDAVRTRLADEFIGFNINMAAIADSYGIDPIVIDFSDESSSFIIGNLSDELLEQLTVNESFDAPFIAIYSAGSLDERSVVMTDIVFAGSVTIGIAVALSIEYEGRKRDYESPGNAVEEALATTFNRAEAIGDLPGGLYYDGKMRRNPPSPALFANDAVTRVERFLLTFGVETR